MERSARLCDNHWRQGKGRDHHETRPCASLSRAAHRPVRADGVLQGRARRRLQPGPCLDRGSSAAVGEPPVRRARLRPGPLHGRLPRGVRGGDGDGVPLWRDEPGGADGPARPVRDRAGAGRGAAVPAGAGGRRAGALRGGRNLRRDAGSARRQQLPLHGAERLHGRRRPDRRGRRGGTLKKSRPTEIASVGRDFCVSTLSTRFETMQISIHGLRFVCFFRRFRRSGACRCGARAARGRCGGCRARRCAPWRRPAPRSRPR